MKKSSGQHSVESKLRITCYNLNSGLKSLRRHQVRRSHENVIGVCRIRVTASKAVMPQG